MKRKGVSLFSPMLAAVLLPMIGVALVFNFQYVSTLRSSLKQEEALNAAQVMRITHEVIEAETSQVQMLGSVLGGLPELGLAMELSAAAGRPTTQLSGLMEQLLGSGDVDRLVAVDHRGRILQQVSRLAPLPESQLPWGLDQAIDGRPMLTVNTANDDLTIDALVPIRGHDGLSGVIIIARLVDDTFANHIQELIGWDLAICTPDQVFASSLPPDRRALIRPDLIERTFYEKKRQTDDDPRAHRTAYYELISLVDEPFGLVLVADSSASAALLARKQKETLGTAFLALLAGLLIAVSVSLWLVRPLRSLKRQFYAVAQELAGASLAADNHNEIAALVQSFGQMEAALRRNQRERQLAQDALEQARDSAEQANRAKSEFLSTMSHEIRTPMTAILGFTDLLGNPGLTEPDRDDYIRIIRNNGNHLLAIINDILDLSKVEAGQMELESIAFSPLAVAEEVVSLIGVQAAEKGIRLVAVPEFPLPAQIVSDSLRVRQVLVNLVGNAVKFTEHGEVLIVINLPDPARTDLIRFVVSDTGAGIDPQRMEHLFQAFCQGDASNSRRFGGTGLGLTISRSLARMLGGDIVAESSPGRGTRMEFTVATGLAPGAPLLDSWDGTRETADADQAAPGLGDLAGRRILLAEDNKFNQRLALLVLRGAGLAVTSVANGLEAVTAVADAAQAGDPFDLVLMDMMMPEMDGLQATRVLRSRGFDLPIVALTANAMEQDRKRCLAAGCDGFTTKPFRKAELLAAIAEQLGGMTAKV